MRANALLLVLLAALAPVAEASISLPVPWKQGMSLRYRSQTSTEKVKGKLHTRVQTQDVNELRVLEADAQGFVQEWRSLKPEVAVTGDGDQAPMERKVALALVARFRDLPLQARLDERGAYKGLRNWQELGAAMREVMLPALVEQNAARKDLKGSKPEDLRAALAPALDRLTTQAAIDASLGKQVALYNFFTAANISRGKPVTYEDTLPSPWSSDSIPSRGSFELTEVNERAGTVTIKWKQGIDPLKGRDAIWKMAGALGIRKEAGAGPNGLPKGLLLSDEATVVIERATGIPLRLTHRRQVAMGASSSTSTWTFEKLAK